MLFPCVSGCSPGVPNGKFGTKPAVRDEEKWKATRTGKARQLQILHTVAGRQIKRTGGASGPCRRLTQAQMPGPLTELTSVSATSPSADAPSPIRNFDCSRQEKRVGDTPQVSSLFGYQQAGSVAGVGLMIPKILSKHAGPLPRCWVTAPNVKSLSRPNQTWSPSERRGWHDTSDLGWGLGASPG